MRIVVALLVFTASLVAAPVPKALKKQPPSFDGAWVLVEVSVDDRTVDPRDTRWLIRGQSVEQYNEGGHIPLNSLLGTPQKLSLVPVNEGGRRVVDFVVVRGKGRDVRPGLYSLDGDTLTLCWGATGERPADCSPGLGREVRVYKRLERIDDTLK